MGYLCGKVEMVNKGYKIIMGQQGLGESNENDERFVNLCAFHNMIIDVTTCPEKRKQKAT